MKVKLRKGKEKRIEFLLIYLVVRLFAMELEKSKFLEADCFGGRFEIVSRTRQVNCEAQYLPSKDM